MSTETVTQCTFTLSGTVIQWSRRVDC